MADFATYAVIMAGGRGTRLWPLSTSSKPKQFIDIDGKPLLTRTFDRIQPLVSAENVLVVTGNGYGELVSACLPSLPERNIIEEPTGRNTAPCIGLGAEYAENNLGFDPGKSVMVVLPADHMVARTEKFRKVVQMGADLAYGENNYVTLGIEPTRPDTGYGYIQGGESIPGFYPARKAVSFTEKPDREKARSFLESGNYYWNSGMFIWRTDMLQRGLKTHLPEIYSGLKRIGDKINAREESKVLAREYEDFSSISIDYGLMEKASDRAVIPASFGWSDLGDWPSLKLVLDEVKGGNNIRGDGEFISANSNLVYNEDRKPVVLLGVDDLVVANTPDALLVMDKERSQQVKEVAKKYRERNGGTDES